MSVLICYAPVWNPLPVLFRYCFIGPQEGVRSFAFSIIYPILCREDRLKTTNCVNSFRVNFFKKICVFSLDLRTKQMYNYLCCKDEILYTFSGGIKMAKNLEISFLLDFYGEMLTKKQHDFLEYYYDEDLSLSEIAENEDITRQGVRDAIKRAENQLFDMENRLGLAKRFNEMKLGLEQIKECAEIINDFNLSHGLSKEISYNAAKIKTIADMLGE